MIVERKYLGEDKPLKKVIPELFPEIPYSEWRACLRRRDVKLNGVRTSSDGVIVLSGTTISLYPKTKKEIKILYEDENVIACYKPKGIQSEGEVSFESALHAERPEARLTHRLDTNTDGVILFSKNERAYREIFAAMKAGRISKVYSAEVYGHPPVGREISLDYYYKKDEIRGRAMLSDHPQNGYIPVHLSFCVEKQKEHSSLLSVKLHKGKMHQIRAMLAFYGFFILGDGKYGSDEINRMLGVKKTLLTARSISFSFPDDSPLAYLNKIVISL